MIVVDTRVVIWLASDPSLLSAAATGAIRTARENGGVGISCISLFELAWLAKNQRIVLKTSLEAFLVEVEARFLSCRLGRLSRASPWSFLRLILSIPWTELSERPR